MDILVTRTGSPLFFGDRNSPRGELDTPSLIEHLDCAVFGVFKKGSSLDDAYVFDMKGIDEWSSAEEIMERADPIIEQLRELNPKVIVEAAGAPPTWSWPANPNGVSVQAFATRYCAPVLYAIHKLNLPRIIVVTDPKCYKRDAEMAVMWPNITPVAVLSQENREWDQIIQGRRVHVHAVYAACEYWNTVGWEPQWAEHRTIDAAICAHSHIGSGRLGKKRDEVWPGILDDAQCNWQMIGQGWEKYHRKDERFLGTVPTQTAVINFMGQGYCCPMIPQRTGFNTSKCRMAALAGSVPLPYGRGEPYTYDIDARVFPLNWPHRFSAGELDAAVARVIKADRRAIVERVLEKTKPDFTVLDRCIDAALAGKLPMKEFGGYSWISS